MMRVVCGVLLDRENRLVMIAKRKHTDQSYPGCWEFPGGKVEKDETDEQALLREWKEELDVDRMEIGFKLCMLNLRRNSGAPFEINAYVVWSIGSIPKKLEHDAIHHVDPRDITRGGIFAPVTPSLAAIAHCIVAHL